MGPPHRHAGVAAHAHDHPHVDAHGELPGPRRAVRAGQDPSEYAAHHHGDSAHTHHAARAGTRALGIAVVLTLGYGVVEALGGFWSGSLALLADAGHMATDAAALLFALAANVVARRPVSERHSFGLARVEVVAAFVNGLAMLAVVVWLLFEALQRIMNPVAVKGGSVFLIAVVGLVVNVVVAWALTRDRDNLNTRAALVHVIGDLLGSVAAIIAGAVIYFTGFTPIDPLLSVLVGGLILRSTIGVLRETTLVLLNSVPSGVDYARVGAALAQLGGVVAVHDLHVWVMVPGRSALSAHVLVDDIARWPAILRQARATLRREFAIDHITLQPEWLRRDAPRRAIPIRRLR